MLRPITASLLVVAVAAGTAPAQQAGPQFDLTLLTKKINRLDVQQKLAESADPLLRQTRVDRVYFAYAEEEKGKVSRTLNFEGVCLSQRYRDDADKLREALLKIFFDLYAGADVPNPAGFKELVKQ